MRALNARSDSGVTSARDISVTFTQQMDSNSRPPCLQQLPTFQPMSIPVFSLGIYCAEDFSHALETTNSEIVHWRINSFKIPVAKAGKEFAHELFRLFLSFASASSMESIALKAARVLPSCSSKSHIACQKRRNKWLLLR